MSGQIRVALLVLCCLIAIVAVGYTQRWFGGEDMLVAERPPRAGPNLSSHPIYSLYDFGKDDHVIDVGIQPLWIPTNIIVEVMRRDSILKRRLSDLGAEIRFHAFLKGADVNFFLFRGDLEVGIAGDMPTLTAAAKKSAVVTTLIQQGFCAIVARSHMLIDELRGKRIAYAFGSNAHYALMHTLSSAGLNEADVELIPLDVNEMPDALAGGRIDAFSAWEPTPFVAETHYENQVVVHRSLSSGYLYFSRSFAERHSEAARVIVASQLRAVSWLKKETNLRLASQWTLSAGQKFSGEPPPLTAADCVILAKRDLLGVASVPVIPQADLAPDGPLRAEFDFLKGLGMIPKTASWDQTRSCFDRSLARDVLASASAYELRTYDYPSDNGDKP